MRVLITGASGFAGGWLARTCAEAGEEVVGLSRSGDLPAGAGSGLALDLRDVAALTTLLADFRPRVIYHLAALSHVGRSWEEPAETLDHNVQGSIHLLEAVRAQAPGARVVWASTNEVYGTVDDLPATEATPVRPVTPYGVSKAAGDTLAGIYAEAHGLQIVRARPFNHTGPGHAPTLLVSSLARQAAVARRDGGRHLRIVTGNPQTRRDFTDVRDVVRAYRLLADRAVPNGVFNIASDRSISTAEHVEMVAELIAPITVEHVIDPDKVRPHEVMDHRGDYAALRAATGWEPSIPIRQTIADMVAWWERELAVAGDQ